MPREADFVSEVSSSTGTGTVIVAGASTGHRTWLAGFGAANTVVHYGIKHASNGTFESGIGTWLHASNGIQRDLVLSSSSGGSKVSFASGGLIVYCQMPAESAKRIQISRSTDVGVDVFAAASQSAALIRASNGLDAVFSVSVTGRVTTDGGVSFGSETASNAQDLSKHILLWGTSYGFNITASTMNYNVSASAKHDIYVGSNRVGRFNAEGLEARLEHTEGYMYIQSYDTASTGVGYGRLYYHATDRALHFSSVNEGVGGTMEIDLGDCSIDGDGHAQIGDCWINKTPANVIDNGVYSTQSGVTMNLQSGAVSMNMLNESGETLGNLVNAGLATTTSGNNIMTRQKGDGRYTLSSSERFKTEIIEVDYVDITEIPLKEWVWGGEMDESHPRYGHWGVGFIAEEVGKVLPKAVTYDQDTGKVQGLDPLTLVANLTKHLGAVQARVAALEAQL